MRVSAIGTFDAERGYVASAPELRQPMVALSLASLRRRIEVALLPTTCASSCILTVSPNATAAGRRGAGH
jgi:hypothetical protein